MTESGQRSYEIETALWNKKQNSETGWSKSSDTPVRRVADSVVQYTCMLFAAETLFECGSVIQWNNFYSIIFD